MKLKMTIQMVYDDGRERNEDVTLGEDGCDSLEDFAFKSAFLLKVGVKTYQKELKKGGVIDIPCEL